MTEAKKCGVIIRSGDYVGMPCPFYQGSCQNHSREEQIASVEEQIADSVKAKENVDAALQDEAEAVFAGYVGRSVARLYSKEHIQKTLAERSMRDMRAGLADDIFTESETIVVRGELEMRERWISKVGVLKNKLVQELEGMDREELNWRLKSISPDETYVEIRAFDPDVIKSLIRPAIPEDWCPHKTIVAYGDLTQGRCLDCGVGDFPLVLPEGDACEWCLVYGGHHHVECVTQHEAYKALREKVKELSGMLDQLEHDQLGHDAQVKGIRTVSDQYRLACVELTRLNNLDPDKLRAEHAELLADNKSLLADNNRLDEFVRSLPTTYLPNLHGGTKDAPHPTAPPPLTSTPRKPGHHD